ncbi:hypothetical protein CWD94_22655 [Lysinibacillus xylanilyticus]|uniref:Uncharacterized protein n=1 Tax=Lysinibacillus xylanilyticus TaxID=582475 RepID=A0A2M9Q025_9BACI|nr:hypothetical protein CWD94_22655 [Lysinibacillus xylanilyticus]
MIKFTYSIFVIFAKIVFIHQMGSARHGVGIIDICPRVRFEPLLNEALPLKRIVAILHFKIEVQFLSQDGTM